MSKEPLENSLAWVHIPGKKTFHACFKHISLIKLKKNLLTISKQEPKTEEKNATHRDFVKISDGKRHYFKNKVCPVDLDKKHGEYTIN